MSKRIAETQIDVSTVKKQTHYCHQCKKHIQGSVTKFQTHLYRHGKVAPRFFCQHCPKQFFRVDCLQRHISKHTGIYKNLYTCDYCDRSFVDKRNLVQHLKVHDDSLHDHPKLSYRCQICDISYAEERNLKYHIRREHYNLNVNQPVFFNKLLNDTWVETVLSTDVCVEVKKLNNNTITIKNCRYVDNKVKCKEENIDIKMECEEAKNYIKINKGIKPLDLTVTKYFSQFSNDTSQYSMATCDYCKKQMLKKSLRLHITERHMKIRKFKCHVCKKGYSRHYLLVKHICGDMRRHRQQNKSKKSKTYEQTT